jgi:regulatory protein
MSISAEDEGQKARQVGLTYLSGRARTVREVRDKLQGKEFAAGVIDQAIEDLKRLALLDDREFARRWIESRIAGQRAAGARKFTQDLRRKGIAAELIAEVLEEFAEELESESAAVKLLSRQQWRYRELDEHKAKRRMLGLLARRGYDHELAFKAVEQAWEEIQRNDLEGD